MGKWPAGISYQSIPVQGSAGTAQGLGRGWGDADCDADAPSSEALGDGASVAVALGVAEAAGAPAEGLIDAAVQAATEIVTSVKARHRRKLLRIPLQETRSRAICHPQVTFAPIERIGTPPAAMP